MGLKKEMILKRVGLLEDIVQELHKSEKGNWWGIPYGEVVGQKKKILMNERSLRKSNFFRDYGTYREIPETNTILMVTKSGGLKIKAPNSNRFVNMTRKLLMRNHYGLSTDQNAVWMDAYKQKHGEEPSNNFNYQIRKWFYKGRKNEWTLDRPECDGYEFFRSFSSLKEVKMFLGYEFLSDDVFYEFLQDNRKIILMFYAATLQKPDRVALSHHLKKKRIGYLIDMWNMLNDARQEGAELESFTIPANHEKLREIHDDLTFKFNQSKALAYSDEEIYYESPLFEELKKKGLKFEVITSARKLYLIGCRSHHCIATRTSSMNTDLFISFVWEGKNYDCQFKKNAMYEFRGYKNEYRPDELHRVVEHALSVVKTHPDFMESIEGELVNNKSIWKMSKDKKSLKKMEYPAIGQGTVFTSPGVWARNQDVHRVAAIDQDLPF